jgi:hypothetical protein
VVKIEMWGVTKIVRVEMPLVSNFIGAQRSVANGVKFGSCFLPGIRVSECDMSGGQAINNWLGTLAINTSRT